MAKDTCRSRTHETPSQFEPSQCRYRPAVVLRTYSHPKKKYLTNSAPVYLFPTQFFHACRKYDAYPNHFMHFAIIQVHSIECTLGLQLFLYMFFFSFTLGGHLYLPCVRYRILLQLPAMDYNHDATYYIVNILIMYIYQILITVIINLYQSDRCGDAAW